MSVSCKVARAILEFDPDTLAILVGKAIRIPGPHPLDPKSETAPREMGK
jgi:hypothetical protein